MISNSEHRNFMLQHIFSSFIYTDQLDIDNTSLEKACYSYEANNATVFASNEGGWQSSSMSYKPEFTKLFDAIQVRCNQLHSELGFKEEQSPQVGNFWININRENNSNNPHSHPGSFFAAVYYVKAEAGAGSIALMHPVDGFQYTVPYGISTHTTSSNQHSWFVEPAPGKLIIFPSWLCHYVQPNKSGSDRISIAFNVGLKRNNC